MICLLYLFISDPYLLYVAFVLYYINIFNILSRNFNNNQSVELKQCLKYNKH